MQKSLTLIMAMLLVSFASAQTKTKPAAGGKKPAAKVDKAALAKQDSLRSDSIDKAEEARISHEFTVYTKKPRTKADRMKLCINLVSEGKVLNYCMNDSLCKDPEVSKVLFEDRRGDTLYVLVYVDAFTKVDAQGDDGRCGAGHETKLVLAKWNTKTNQAKWKQKNIASCLRGITNMTKDPILDWDKSSALNISYHRGANFYDVMFDPAQPQMGFQSAGGDSEGK